MSNIAVIVQII